MMEVSKSVDNTSISRLSEMHYDTSRLDAAAAVLS